MDLGWGGWSGFRMEWIKGRGEIREGEKGWMEWIWRGGGWSGIRNGGGWGRNQKRGSDRIEDIVPIRENRIVSVKVDSS